MICIKESVLQNNSYLDGAIGINSIYNSLKQNILEVKEDIVLHHSGGIGRGWAMSGGEVAGLDMDFKGKPFGPMPALMATAEYVTKVHAVCTKTGNLAHFSHRTIPDERLVVLGEVHEYEPLSRAAFYKERQKEQQEKEELANGSNEE